MKKTKYITTLLVVAFTFTVTAQVTPPPILPPPPPGLSIDGGLLLLLISGLIYGVKKLKR